MLHSTRRKKFLSKYKKYVTTSYLYVILCVITNFKKNSILSIFFYPSRLEKGVMAYGWGRWEEVLNHAQLRKGWTHEDVEEALRLSCIYSLIIYKVELYYLSLSHCLSITLSIYPS